MRESWLVGGDGSEGLMKVPLLCYTPRFSFSLALSLSEWRGKKERGEDKTVLSPRSKKNTRTRTHNTKNKARAAVFAEKIKKMPDYSRKRAGWRTVADRARSTGGVRRRIGTVAFVLGPAKWKFRAFVSPPLFFPPSHMPNAVTSPCIVEYYPSNPHTLPPTLELRALA